MIKSNKQGFTLLEILLVVAIIAVLAGIIILAINPKKQLGDSRNTRRQADVNTILSSVYQYYIDNSTTTTLGIPSSETEICRTDANTCTGLIDLSLITEHEKYLTAIPTDPTGNTENGTGYIILRTINGRIKVTAPNAENSEVISATR